MTATNRASATHPISLSDPSRDLDTGLLEAKGGFAWWYLDHVDDAGDGLVAIWSFGLPFLPNYLGAAREGRGQPAGHRPSLNLVLYEAGRPSFYLLQEYDPSACRWEDERWRFGDSQLRLERAEGRAVLHAELDCPIPRSRDRLTGTIRAEGASVRYARAAGARVPEHEWSPLLGPAELQVDLQAGAQRFERRGFAYHDRNGGTAPLDQLGIRSWTWGRWVEPEQTLIYYVLWPEEAGAPPVAWGVRIGADGLGTVQEGLEVAAGGTSRATYGMRHHPELTLRLDGQDWLTVRTRRIVDDGPFYLRTQVEREGAPGLGMGEWVEPARVDRPWQRPFVRMRVHDTTAGNSPWLPLFSGPRQGRLSRLFGRVQP